LTIDEYEYECWQADPIIAKNADKALISTDAAVIILLLLHPVTVGLLNTYHSYHSYYYYYYYYNY